MPFRAVGQNGKGYARFFHAKGKASNRLRDGVGGGKKAESVWASLLRSCDSSERAEEST